MTRFQNDGDSISSPVGRWFLLGMMIGNFAVGESSSLPFIRPKDLPGVAQPETARWVSLSHDIDFLPTDDMLAKAKRSVRRQLKRRALQEGEEEEGEDEEDGEEFENDETGEWESYNPYSVQPFVEGLGDYDEYQQAWRMLGFMIDCNSVPSQYEEQDDHRGSRDEATTDEGCARYILWAAYVDLEYEGAGIGEYQYWDPTSNTWDDTACQYAERGGGSRDGGGESRCAKMDCHEESTHFSLLGFFKHRNYDDWMEQLFKHEGMCVWSDEEYAFMKRAREAWPQGCTATGNTTEDGEALYYDIKPVSNGRIVVGLYTDSKCIDDYPSNSDMIEELLGNFLVNNGGGSHDQEDGNNYDFSNDTLAESLERWDSAFGVWQMCHPCVAHDLENIHGHKYLDDDYYHDDYYSNNNDGNYTDDGNARQLGGQYSAQGDVFECYDDAGYTNVNQCMKFSAKTAMETATFRDLSLARSQGTLVAHPLSGYLNSGGHYRREWIGNFLTYSLLVVSMVVVLCSCGYLYRSVKETDYDVSEAVRESLLVDKAADA